MPVVLLASPTFAATAPDPDWARRAEAGIAALEYRFAWQNGVLQAPNRVHDLRTSIRPDGFEIVSRTQGADELRFELALRRIGRGDARVDVDDGVVSLGDTRAELRRRGGITEWFINDTKGLKHGVDLAAPPGGEDGGVVLELSLAGNVTAFPEGPRAVSLRNPQGSPVVLYGGLAVFDARGEALPSRFEIGLGVLRIVFDDRGATYPVTVDPLATAPSWSFEPNQAGARAGNAVSTAGDVNGDGYSDVIVAAGAYDEPGLVDAGRVFLFLGNASGNPGAPVGGFSADQAGANLGCSVAALGDVNGDGYDDVAVGAFTYDTQGIPDRGRVYVFHGGPSGLDFTPARILDGAQTAEYFGVRVAGADVNGDGYRDLIVGAFGYDIRSPFVIPDVGKVAVYLGSASGIATSPVWQRIGEVESEQLGAGLAGLGDVNGDGYEDFAAGATGWDGPQGGQDNRGAVDVIHGGSGTPSLGVRIVGTQNGAQLGNAVAGGDFDGDGYADLAVASMTWDGATSDEGMVQVYRGGAGGIGAGAPWWTRVGGVENAQLGFSLGTVDANGDGLADLLIGSDVWDDWDTVVDVGQVSMHHGRRGGLSATPDWVRTGTQNFAYLGVSIASAGDVNGDGFGDVVVGEYGWDGPEFDEGRATLYLGSGGTPQDAFGAKLATSAATEQFGYSVASAGDVNGDGYADAIVGAPYYDNGQVAEGKVFFYSGGPSGLTNAPTWVWESNQANALFGAAVAGAGDINGDGYDDVLVGAPWFDGPEVNEGSVFPFLGSAFGLNPAPTIESNQSSAFLGTSLSSAGDVDGDGYAEVALGAPFFDVGSFVDAGRLWVCKGSAAGIVQPCTWNADGGQNGEQMGSASAAGDFNRDGYSDLLIGAPGYDFIYGQEGRVLIYLGGSGGLASGPVWQRSGNGVSQAGADINLGHAVAAVGDVNGDGYGDWVVGAPGGLRNGGPPYEGVAVLYYGAANLTGVFETWFTEGGQDHAGYGTAVAAAGDVNGDGYDDFAVGARDWDEGGSTSQGKLWLYLGSPFGVSTGASWTQTGGVTNQFAASISAGDFDGDGFSDLLVGAPYESLSKGAAHVYYGNGGRGARRLGRQAFQGNVLRPVAMLGMTDTTGFNAKIEAGSPAGRSRVAAQVELKPFLVPFDGIVLGSAGPQLMGPGGAPVSYAVAFAALPVNTPHKWRYRVRTANPAFPRTPWLEFRAVGSTQTDFRTVCGLWYGDADGDGYGRSSDVSTACSPPAGYVAQNGDCDDGNGAIHPGAPELCDAVDNDCDRVVDDGAPRPIVTGLVGQKVVDASQYWVGWSWNAAPGATSYDVLRVWLDDVRAIGGFTADADSACTADNLAATFVAEDGAIGVPPPWSEAYLVRANSVCGATYDSGSPSQVLSRDGVSANPGACP
jgi:hypothetical protein